MSNTLNPAMVAAAATSQKAVIGAEVVTQTLDKLNQYQSKSKKCKNSMSASYDFQKSVLSAVYQPKGTITETSS